MLGFCAEGVAACPFFHAIASARRHGAAIADFPLPIHAGPVHLHLPRRRFPDPAEDPLPPCLPSSSAHRPSTGPPPPPAPAEDPGRLPLPSSSARALPPRRAEGSFFSIRGGDGGGRGGTSLVVSQPAIRIDTLHTTANAYRSARGRPVEMNVGVQMKRATLAAPVQLKGGASTRPSSTAGVVMMAKRRNPKKEKAARNRENMRRFKKRTTKRNYGPGASKPEKTAREDSWDSPFLYDADGQRKE